MDWDKPYADMEFPGSVDERIQTRLGEGDRRVKFTPPFRGPFGLEVREVSLRASWIFGAAADAEAEDVVSDPASGAARFRFGAKQFVYDRLGLRIDRQDDAKETSDADGP
ncbi:MAG: hypothetical protein QM765_43870 [Myxococcales bacterium]